MEWISIKDKMPERSNIDILVNVKNCCFMGRYDKGGWDLYFSDAGLATAGDYHKPEITHWMPLPELPKQ